MRVVFVALGQEQLGISILSAVLNEGGHETALVFEPGLFDDRYYFDVPVLKDVFRDDDALADEVVAHAPQLVAFSVLTPMYTWSLGMARRIKSRIDVPVIFGGVHPSAVPDRCLEEDPVDYVCVGEGERAMLALCADLEQGAHPPRAAIPNLRWKTSAGDHVVGSNAPFIQDLDALPYPDKALWDGVVRHRDNYMTMTARGCPYRCTFCFNNYFAKLPGRGGGKYVRQRSVDDVLGELRAMKARYGFRHVGFEDDIFTLNKEWMREFLSRYEREIGVPFSCLVHPRFIDHDVAGWLRDAGCDRVQMGIQSADEEYKRRQLLRMEKEAHVDRALEAMSAEGLRMKLDHMFGLPNEPREAQDKALELFRAYPPARVNTYWLSYLPGTEILEQAVQAGRVGQDDLERINTGRDRMFHHMNEATRDTDFAFHQPYELLFRALPLMPRWMRRRAQPRHVPHLPPPVARAAGFALDLAAAAVQRDTETWVYARHYLHHLGRWARSKLGQGPKGWAPLHGQHRVDLGVAVPKALPAAESREPLATRDVVVP